MINRINGVERVCLMVWTLELGIEGRRISDGF